DALDGLIARTTGQLTTLGAWLDPMADKLLLLTVFVMLTMPSLHLPNHLPLWLTVLVISRDVGIVLTVAVVNLAVARRTFRPSLLANTATVLSTVTAGVALLANYIGRPLAIVRVFVYLSLVITLLSGFDYLLRVMRQGTDRVN